jgi:pimeloyl-ACP methyl ester carboxylesterase
VTTLLLIHGGLWEAAMNADRFWTQPGITAGLQHHGFTVLTPDRLPQPPDWTAEADHLAPSLPGPPTTVLAGSNGCSAAARLAIAFPDQIERLLLAWPATANDPAVDARTRSHLVGLNTPPKTIDALLTGHTLRGVTDEELASLTMPTGLLPAVPDNPFHQRHTLHALRGLLPQADELPGCPEPPRPDFPPHLASFLDTVTRFTAG